MPSPTFNALSGIRVGHDFSTILAMSLLPALATLVSFYLEVMPHLIYFGSKALMILLPIWVWRKQGLDRAGILRQSGFTMPTGFVGLFSGLALGGIVVGGYYVLFAGSLDPAPIHAKLSSLGVMPHFWVAAVFICLWNSALEEWFWRGFVLERMQRSMSGTTAVLLSSLLFGVHHYFTLLAYFPTNLAAFFTFGTMVAGAVWGFMRLRGVSLVDCWISHVLADLAVVSVGWLLINQIVG